MSQQIISNAVAHLNDQAVVTMPAVHHIAETFDDRERELETQYLYHKIDSSTSLQNISKQLLVKPSFSMTLVMGMIKYWSLQQMKISSFLPNLSHGLWMVLSKHCQNYSLRSTPSIAALQTEYCLVSMPFFPTNNKLPTIDYLKF